MENSENMDLKMFVERFQVVSERKKKSQLKTQQLKRKSKA